MVVTLGRGSARSAPFAAIAGMLAVSVLTISPAHAQQAQFITVILTELQFTPNTITLTVGQPVQLNVQNQGKADHNLSSELPISNVKYQKADNTPSDLRNYEANNVLDVDARAGSTSVVTFTPTKAGTFRFVSGEGDDEKNGMVGTFVSVAPGVQAVTPPAAAPAPAASTATSTVARDGQGLSSQSAATQAMFTAVWGDRAAQRWVQEHESELGRLGR